MVKIDLQTFIRTINIPVINLSVHISLCLLRFHGNAVNEIIAKTDIHTGRAAGKS